MRRVHQPPISYTPRTDVSNPSVVDAALKNLKLCTRRLNASLSVHHDELHILQRIYYKGKNQHRSALFFKRMAGMRRFGERLDEMNMLGLVDALRTSFFGEQAIQNQKLTKGAWGYLPNTKFVLHVIERSKACISLLEQMHLYLLSAYEMFNMSMQSGYFLQLVLMLAAIASRMDALLPEISDALEHLITTCEQLLSMAENPSKAIEIDTPMDIDIVEPIEPTREPSPPVPTITTDTLKKKKKKKKPRDEIDDIFG